VKKVAFALACFPYMQWHNGMRHNHRHSIACNGMHQMKHTTLFQPQLSWPDMDLRTAYSNIFVTNAFVKPFALLTKPKGSLTTLLSWFRQWLRSSWTVFELQIFHLHHLLI
jgi:hypothetical protein